MCISSRKFCQEPTLALPKVYQRMLGEVPRVPRPLKSVQASKTVHCLYSALRLVAWNLCRLQRRIIICSSAIYCWRRPLRSQAGEAWEFLVFWPAVWLVGHSLWNILSIQHVIVFVDMSYYPLACFGKPVIRWSFVLAHHQLHWLIYLGLNVFLGCTVSQWVSASVCCLTATMFL